MVVRGETNTSTEVTYPHLKAVTGSFHSYTNRATPSGDCRGAGISVPSARNAEASTIQTDGDKDVDGPFAIPTEFVTQIYELTG